MRRLFLSLVVVVSLMAAGEAQQRQSYIINGEPTDGFPSVGIVGEASVGGFCTGTLISPRHVLTAAHCAEAILAFGTADSGTFELAGRVFRTTSVEIIPSYDNRNFFDDVAILVLAEAVTEVEPAELSTFHPEVGEVVTIVGYGAEGTPEEGSDGGFGTKQVGMVVVDNVTDNEFSWLFDDPTESNPAPGDSGGPVFIATEVGFLLAGIISSGTASDAQLGDTSYSMRVDAYEAWITETVLWTTELEQSTEEPAEENAPDCSGIKSKPPTGRPGGGHHHHHHHHHYYGCSCRLCSHPPPPVCSNDEAAASSPADLPVAEAGDDVPAGEGLGTDDGPSNPVSEPSPTVDTGGDPNAPEAAAASAQSNHRRWSNSRREIRRPIGSMVSTSRRYRHTWSYQPAPRATINVRRAGR